MGCVIQAPQILEHIEQIHHCEYCQSRFVPDSRGNCSCCGAPYPKNEQSLSRAEYGVRFFYKGLKTLNEAREELDIGPISADHEIFLR